MKPIDYYNISNLFESFERRLAKGDSIEEVISDLRTAKNAYRKIALNLIRKRGERKNALSKVWG